MARHRFVIEEAAVESFYRLPLRHRERLLDVFTKLTDEAHIPGENAFKDHADRWILTKEMLGWKVWYWVDGPVNEVRIVAVTKRSR